jgi:hypothetical protein
MIFHRAARYIDAWLAAVGIARAAWRVLPGCLMALLVMRACGIPGPGRTHKDGDTTAILVEDPRAALYLDHQWIPVRAQTLGRYVFARERLSERSLAHELEHVRQWQRLGPLFLPAYVAASAAALIRGRQPYWANAFEEAARQREGDYPA